MDKNSVIGLILIAVLLVAYTLYNQPGQAEIEAQRRAMDSAAAAAAEQDAANRAALTLGDTLQDGPGTVPADATADSLRAATQNAELASKYGIFAPAAQGQTAYTTVETDLMRLKFSNRGGVPVEVTLKEYNTYDSLPLVLFDEETAALSYDFTYP